MAAKQRYIRILYEDAADELLAALLLLLPLHSAKVEKGAEGKELSLERAAICILVPCDDDMRKRESAPDEPQTPSLFF